MLPMTEAKMFRACSDKLPGVLLAGLLTQSKETRNVEFGGLRIDTRVGERVCTNHDPAALRKYCAVG